MNNPFTHATSNGTFWAGCDNCVFGVNDDCSDEKDAFNQLKIQCVNGDVTQIQLVMLQLIGTIATEIGLVRVFSFLLLMNLIKIFFCFTPVVKFDEIEFAWKSIVQHSSI